MNWNSKTGKFTEVVNQRTREMKVEVIKLDRQGYSRKEIATLIGRSVSRVGELLRGQAQKHIAKLKRM